MKILKITALVLSLIMILSLISCGKKKSEDADAAAPDTETLVTDTETISDTETALVTDTKTASDTGKTPETETVTEKPSSPETEKTAETKKASEITTVMVYSPDDELFSTPPMLGDVDGLWHVLSASGEFIRIGIDGKWTHFTCENGEFKTLHSGKIVKDTDGYIYAEGDGVRQKIDWLDTLPCFEKYGKLYYCTDDELVSALDESVN